MIQRRALGVLCAAWTGLWIWTHSGDAWAVSVQGAQRTCVEGEVKELCVLPKQQGDCSLGVIRCVDGRWSPCRARFRKLPERCGRQPTDGLGEATGDEDCDGAVDEFEPNNPAINCVTYMLDKDGDGYGAIGPSYDEDPVKATYGCFCPDQFGKVPLKFGVPAKGKQNLDCGDCSGKEGELVHPGVKDYFTTQSECLSELGWKGGAFDYNCSEEEEPQHLGIHGCDFDKTANCVFSGSGFWAVDTTDEIPACGKRGSQNSCQSWPQTLEGHEDFCYLRQWFHPVLQACR